MEMNTIVKKYRTDIRFLEKGLFEVTSPDFPGASATIVAPDEAEAFQRSRAFIVGCVIAKGQAAERN